MLRLYKVHVDKSRDINLLWEQDGHQLWYQPAYVGHQVCLKVLLECLAVCLYLHNSHMDHPHSSYPNTAACASILLSLVHKGYDSSNAAFATSSHPATSPQNVARTTDGFVYLMPLLLCEKHCAVTYRAQEITFGIANRAVGISSPFAVICPGSSARMERSVSLGLVTRLQRLAP